MVRSWARLPEICNVFATCHKDRTLTRPNERSYVDYAKDLEALIAWVNSRQLHGRHLLHLECVINGTMCTDHMLWNANSVAKLHNIEPRLHDQPKGSSSRFGPVFQCMYMRNWKTLPVICYLQALPYFSSHLSRGLRSKVRPSTTTSYNHDWSYSWKSSSVAVGTFTKDQRPNSFWCVWKSIHLVGPADYRDVIGSGCV